MTRTMKELADFLGCTLEGDGAALVSGVASPASARAEDLIYVDSPRHLDRAAASAARCVVIAPGLSMPGKILLRAANPKLAFARAAEWLLPPAPIAKGIHPTAVIAPSAQLAPGVAVGPYAVIEEDVQDRSGHRDWGILFPWPGRADRGRMPPVSSRDAICRRRASRTA